MQFTITINQKFNLKKKWTAIFVLIMANRIRIEIYRLKYKLQQQKFSPETLVDAEGYQIYFYN